VRALVVSNMRPDATHPERGSFVRDQVAALGKLDGLEVELREFAPGAASLARAALALRREARNAARGGRERFDVVHAHFGLTAYPALGVPAAVHALTLHGTDLRHPRTRLATRAVLGRVDLLATASQELLDELPSGGARARAQVLPCGVDTDRFRPLARERARAELGLDPHGHYLLFAADPARPAKRYDRARGLALELGTPLLTLGGVAPARVPLSVNAADAVLVTSEREGFGLAVLEALACDVPVLATPVGVHREALEAVDGALCAPFDLAAWRAALEPHVLEADPRIAGRASATRFSAVEMAARVAAAWRDALRRPR
jgi:teichuronic acid biosynthesis glycosyltransferase TuaC